MKIQHEKLITELLTADVGASGGILETNAVMLLHTSYPLARSTFAVSPVVFDVCEFRGKFTEK